MGRRWQLRGDESRRSHASGQREFEPHSVRRVRVQSRAPLHPSGWRSADARAAGRRPGIDYSVSEAGGAADRPSAGREVCRRAPRQAFGERRLGRHGLPGAGFSHRARCRDRGPIRVPGSEPSGQRRVLRDACRKARSKSSNNLGTNLFSSKYRTPGSGPGTGPHNGSVLAETHWTPAYFLPTLSTSHKMRYVNQRRRDVPATPLNCAPALGPRGLRPVLLHAVFDCSSGDAHSEARSMLAGAGFTSGRMLATRE